MGAISSGREFLKIFSRMIIGHESWQDYMIDYFNLAVQDCLGMLSSESGIVGEPLPVISFDGSVGDRVLTIGTGEFRFLLNSQIGIFSPGVTPGCTDIPYDEAANQYMALRLDEYPIATDVGTDGTVGYKWNVLGVGENHTPSAVSVEASSIVLTLNTIPVWTKVGAVRPVVVYLATPITSSTEAIYSGNLEVVDGALQVTIPHFLSQAVPSSTAADYCVFVCGPSIAAAAQSTAEYVRVCNVVLGSPDPTFQMTATPIKNLTSLKSIIRQIAQALSAVAVGGMTDTQLAGLIINRIATAGEFSSSLKVSKHPLTSAFLNFLDKESYGVGQTRGFLRTGHIYSLFGLSTGAPESSVQRIDENGNMVANNLSVAGKVSNPDGDVVVDDDLDVTGKSKFRGKLSNVDGADVVFDDGLTAEGMVTAQGGLATTNDADVTASWDAGSIGFLATMNAVGGVIVVPCDASHPIPASTGGTLSLVVSNSRIDTNSRVLCNIDYAASSSKLPAFALEVNAGELVVVLYNLGASAIENNVRIQFEIINPAAVA
jgi:hypothetical protein